MSSCLGRLARGQHEMPWPAEAPWPRGTSSTRSPRRSPMLTSSLSPPQIEPLELVAPARTPAMRTVISSTDVMDTLRPTAPMWPNMKTHPRLPAIGVSEDVPASPTREEACSVRHSASASGREIRPGAQTLDAPASSPPSHADQMLSSPKLVQHAPNKARTSSFCRRECPSSSVYQLSIRTPNSPTSSWDVVDVVWKMACPAKDKDHAYRTYDFLVMHEKHEPADQYLASLYMMGGRTGVHQFIAPKTPGQYRISAVRDMQQVVELMPLAQSDESFVKRAVEHDQLYVLGFVDISVHGETANVPGHVVMPCRADVKREGGADMCDAEGVSTEAASLDGRVSAAINGPPSVRDDQELESDHRVAAVEQRERPVRFPVKVPRLAPAIAAGPRTWPTVAADQRSAIRGH